jgi:hypothetical protein
MGLPSPPGRPAGGHANQVCAGTRQLRRKIVTVFVEDTHCRVTCDGAEISLHPRAEQRPSRGGKPRSHGQRPERASSDS